MPFEALNAEVVKYKDNLILALPEEFKNKVEVYGQVPRVDLTPEGYSVWLFDKSAKNWRDEIRFPLIQAAYARKFSPDLEEGL